MEYNVWLPLKTIRWSAQMDGAGTLQFSVPLPPLPHPHPRSVCLVMCFACLAPVDIWGHHPHPRSWVWFYRREAPKVDGFKQVTFSVWPEHLAKCPLGSRANHPLLRTHWSSCNQHLLLEKEGYLCPLILRLLKGNAAPSLVYGSPGKKMRVMSV